MLHIKKVLVKIYEYCYEKRRIFQLRINYHLHIMSPYKTLSYIEKNRCSIARYGDGEFDHMLDRKDEGFQSRSVELKKGLIKVMQNKNPHLLICIPRCMNTIRGCNHHAGTFWIEWGRNGHHEEIVNMIRMYTGKLYVFGDSQITRPYIDWVSDRRAKKTFMFFKQFFSEKKLLIVEGENTCLGIGNDMFSNARQIRRIIVPAKNAFGYYDSIKESILNNYSDELVLLAVGPTATILASDLCDLGIQALDIGHIDLEYEWFLRRSKEREIIPGKYTNEVKGGEVCEKCFAPEYLDQIIDNIGV